jgi:hypothetical protein
MVGKEDLTERDRLFDRDKGKGLVSSSTLNRLELTPRIPTPNRTTGKSWPTPLAIHRRLPVLQKVDLRVEDGVIERCAVEKAEAVVNALLVGEGVPGLGVCGTQSNRNLSSAGLAPRMKRPSSSLGSRMCAALETRA